MNLLIHELKYKNIRDFKNFNIKLTKENTSPYHISLIQMPNGTGKTTTITLIQYALFNKEWDLPRKVREYEPTRFQASTGTFELLYSLNSEPYSIKIDFDYELGKAVYSTSSPTSGGYKRGHDIPRQIKSLMTEEFTKLFIFDGEMASDLFNSQKAKAENAIRSVFYLDRLNPIKTRIEDALSKKLSSAKKTKAKVTSSLKNIETEIQRAESRLREMLSDAEKLNLDRDNFKAELRTVTKQLETITSADVDFKDKYEDINQKLSEVETNIAKNTEVIKDILRNPSNWSSKLRKNLDNLNHNMIKLRLPRTASQSFFEELSEGSTCICGESLDTHKKNHILKMAETYLDHDSTMIIDAMKLSMKNLSYQNPKSNFQDIQNLRTEQAELRQERDYLEQTADKERKDQFEKLNPERDEIKKNLDEVESILEVLGEKNPKKIKSFDYRPEENISLMKTHISEKKKILAEATGTVEFNNQCTLLKEIIDDIDEKALLNIKEVLVQKTNQKISKILEGEIVSIERIGNSLIIERKQGISAGQQVSVGYSYISTLFENKLLALPFIIDSPAGPLDFTVRRRVASFLPSLFNQLILFVIPSERPEFVNKLEAQVDSTEVQYFTAHKDKVNMGNMICKSNDKKYFNLFDINDDKEIEEVS